MKIKNEILYKLYIYFSDLLFPCSAQYQKERYITRYGTPDKSITFFGKYGNGVTLHGKDFYKHMLELNDTPLFKQIRKDIKEKGSFTLDNYI